MVRKFRFSILPAVAVLILVAAFSSGMLVFAQGEGGDTTIGPTSANGSLALNSAAPVPGGPGFYSQSALLFKPYSTSQTSYLGQSLYNPGTGTGVYEAPVALPNGAVITKFVLYYVDTGSETITAYLARGDFSADYGTVIGAVSSVGADAGFRFGEDTTIITPLVDLQTSMYWIELLLPATSTYRVVSFRIDYTYPSALPVIRR